jgi:hypothetical protein
MDLGESRSPTQIFQRNLLPRFPSIVGVCVCSRSGADGDDADGDGDGDGDGGGGGDGDGDGDGDRKHLVGYINVNVKASTDLKPSIGQNFHKLRVQWAQIFLWKRYSCRNAALSSTALKQALKQALK